MANQLLSTVSCHDTLPEGYARPESDRPRLAEVATDSNIPLIDLASPDKLRVIAEIDRACRTYGFFQVINHGISEELLEKVMAVGLEFFRLPPEEKAKLYSDEPSKKIRLSTSFNVRKETVHNWRDYLRLHCHPLEEFVPDWPSNPEAFKEIISTYCREVRLLGLRLMGAISLSLGLDENYVENVLGEQEQHMAVNYYPRCPEPDLTYGLPKHTDPNALTVLLQDPNVSGLQVLKDGQWIAVDPRPNALVINLGDQLQFFTGAEQRRVQERVAPGRGERGAGAHVGGIFPVPVQQRRDRPRGEARRRRGRARVPELHLRRVLQQVLEQEPRPGALPGALQRPEVIRTCRAHGLASSSPHGVLALVKIYGGALAIAHLS
ncbi:flavanone 3-dioxygenase 2 isoform X1 [Brachypodium distachyon]|uniref:flavanone 3-dioxygenase 2 isoform X1 n=1 Tax=Brachypodium distachyon TaxID=15368 RepID=UPI000D0CBA78|nr:flavanone 3-dioxygenase 2 isoform X1 [Brachypodium distachyon]|eukprot:XP_024311889.1 flavanone 3-dioxygenase 2 isoform X1 [Brachypodium distachyon]